MIRFTAMSSIIACHFCQYYGSEWAWWLNVGVQIFFIISGYLYGTKKLSSPFKWMKRQFSKIMIPYWICLSFTLIVYFFHTPYLLSIKRVIGAYFTLGTIKGIEHLWFISYILFCYLITPFLSYLRDYLVKCSIFKTLIILIVMLSIYSLCGVFLKIHFRPGLVCCYIVGYFIAVLQSRVKINVVKLALFSSILPCLFLNAIYCYFRYYHNLDMRHGVMLHLTDYSHLSLGLTITLLMMTFVRKVKDSLYLRFSDKSSYEIYLVHQIFILSPFSLLGITEFPIINIILTICTILIFGSLLHYINKKCNDRFFNIRRRKIGNIVKQ